MAKMSKTTFFTKCLLGVFRNGFKTFGVHMNLFWRLRQTFKHKTVFLYTDAPHKNVIVYKRIINIMTLKASMYVISLLRILLPTADLKKTISTDY